MRTTKFERVTRRLFFVCGIACLFAFVGLSGFDYFYTIKCQSLEKEMQTIESSIDALNMEVQELGSLDRLTEIAVSNGYTYQSDATAARYNTSIGDVQ